MPRPISKVAPDWWDYTSLDSDLIDEAARLTPGDLLQLSRPGFDVVFYDTLEDFYLAEALEYIRAWKQATPDNPVGICGPIGPTEQLPLVARLVNELELDLHNAHFWGMDEWFETGKPVPPTIRFRSRRPIGSCASTASDLSCACRPKTFISRPSSKRIRTVTTKCAAR